MGSGLLSPTHLAVVLAIALIVFGPRRLPELGRALGSGMRSFKDAISGEDEPDAIDSPASTPTAAPAQIAQPTSPGLSHEPAMSSGASDAAPRETPAADGPQPE